MENELSSHVRPLRGPLAAVALSALGCSGSAHSTASQPPVYLAQSQCGPTDSTVSCCVKTHPATPERCGLTASELRKYLAPMKAAEAAADASADTLPEWKQVCIDAYALCQEQKWSGSCYDCFRYCEGQREWPVDKCRRVGKGE
ncbi:hypothetical protein [Comamonas sp. JC664]|uniref:hypothetical protein n=1 Tax=Comamonas sp. JC664 TaxID=2801917 RepID=UPI0019A8D452|nr:hypothetical protein [Comamonas sp. JC664]GHG67974.1 hypothetical protein GCM10012319_10710 [Comamonas sp. KCTC 72670]